ncbi:aconitate hydratase 1 [bacterium F11]|nr:aconitate hydratase 1 [bacterium F11]
MSKNTYKTQSTLKVGSKSYTYFSLNALKKADFLSAFRLPFSLKILLENLLRKEDGVNVTKEDIQTVEQWDPGTVSNAEISFMPARVILQDFTGVPCVVDLASMRDAVADMGGDPKIINPLQQVDLVIDHSVQVDAFGNSNSYKKNVELEYQRNSERYSFLKWGQESFQNFRVVPPGTGIVHQVNLEHLGTVVYSKKEEDRQLVYPDSLIGTDSHTTMINALGILGWGVGGIEAEAAMLGQAVSMLLPSVVGFKLEGSLPNGVTATDLVLTVTQMLRKKGVVGKFVEFYGAGLNALSLPDRATIANMCPEYGATVGFFPVDQKTLDYLTLTGRPKDIVDLVEAYTKEQGLFRTDKTPDPHYSDTLELDLSDVRPSLAGPKRPQDRIELTNSKFSFEQALPDLMKSSKVDSKMDSMSLSHGSIVIAAITSCTNTSNPSVLIEAGLLAKKAVEKGLRIKPWVKTSLSPGSKVVVDYLRDAGLLEYLEKLGFYLVGYGCTTCIGNSGPLPIEVEKPIKENDLVVASVLSGNRNFEGRIHPLVRANYLMSPPLVVAFALAGSMGVDLTRDPIGKSQTGEDVFLQNLWPTPEETQKAINKYVKTELFKKEYAVVFEGEEDWKKIDAPLGYRFRWDRKSTYIRRASFLEGISRIPQPVSDIKGARVLAFLGDSVTTDHISPAGAIAEDSPAGQYLVTKGVQKANFNSYGSRRGNHEVMVRGTFANIRIRNKLVPETEGGFTKKFPEGKTIRIYDAAVSYALENRPLLIVAGKEYGSGSSRDWAAKGTKMLGVRAVLAESFERIHRSNLIMMGVLPLEFKEGENAISSGFTGEEIFNIEGIGPKMKPQQDLVVRYEYQGIKKDFAVRCRIDTPQELAYYLDGGILPYVIRQLIGA